ncbi:DUF1192 domain-containing protein [Zavarzinia sp.]|uniref:DUF1192 domain-containing protein n=1 Tax=Zavarzinia sp. TaxID=2027920 RepID=UPI003569ADF7
MFDTEDRPRPKTALTVEAVPLDPLSVEDLEARIASCREEIARCEAEIAKKHAHRNAADAFFKR